MNLSVWCNAQSDFKTIYCEFIARFRRNALPFPAFLGNVVEWVSTVDGQRIKLGLFGVWGVLMSQFSMRRNLFSHSIQELVDLGYITIGYRFFF